MAICRTPGPGGPKVIITPAPCRVLFWHRSACMSSRFGGGLLSFPEVEFFLDDGDDPAGGVPPLDGIVAFEGIAFAESVSNEVELAVGYANIRGYRTARRLSS